VACLKKIAATPHLYAFLLLLPVALIATGIFLFGLALGDGLRGLRYY
jgi:hypothetical protein